MPEQASSSLIDAPWAQGEEVRAILKAMRDAGGEARFVGGAVRDTFLGRAVGDIDLAVNLPPEKVVQALEKAQIKAKPTGIAHGTVTAIVAHKGYEITSLRRDVETDGRRAKVAFTDDWQADAARRDFTINALYLDGEGRLYDYFGGREDLAARRVRFIGDAEDRIREDVLRILRYFRFLVQIDGQTAPDDRALAACRALAPLLSGLSAERVWKELSRLLVAENPLSALRLMAETGVMAQLLPEYEGTDRLARLMKIEKTSGAGFDAVRHLAALVGRGATDVARRLRLSKEQTARFMFLAALPPALTAVRTARELRQILYDHGRPFVQDGLLLGRAGGGAWTESDTLFQSLWDEASHWQRPVFPLQGQDLLALGFAPGPKLGQILAQAERRWRDLDFRPTHGECLEAVKKSLG